MKIGITTFFFITLVALVVWLFAIYGFWKLING